LKKNETKNDVIKIQSVPISALTSLLIILLLLAGISFTWLIKIYLLNGNEKE
jgi:hypothetical protein